MTLYEELVSAGLPVKSATEDGQIQGIPGQAFTDEQMQTMKDILLQHFHPTEYAEVLQQRADLQALKDEYVTMIARLDQIQNATNPTNAQVLQAIKDEALYIERIMKFLKRLLT